MVITLKYNTKYKIVQFQKMLINRIKIKYCWHETEGIIEHEISLFVRL